MKWSNIRALGKVKYFNVCYVVLLGVPLLAEIYIYVHERGAYPSFPTPLKLLYVASICYAIGIALYQYCCPVIIKMYERDIDYLQAEKEVHMNARPDRKLEIVLANLLDVQQDTRAELEELKKLSNLSEAQKTKLNSIIEIHYPSCVQRYLLADYDRQNAKWWGLILLCGLFYFGGTAIMLWLLVVKSIKVFCA